MQESNGPVEMSQEGAVNAQEGALAQACLEDLPESMRQACARAGWTRLMPVQSQALPCLMSGSDCMVQSRTGSGKTGAYLLPMLTLLDPEQNAPQALILAPTRELASQVEHEAGVLFEGTGLRVASLYGGVGYGRQLDALRTGVQVIVGTPGRVLDHLMRRTLALDRLRFLVFDEADRMLSIGFYPDMKQIQRYLPRRHVLSALFSATYPQHVLNLAGEFLEDPRMVSLSQGQVHVASIAHLFVECGRMDKDRTLVRLLETENPTSAIIFCNTKSTVHYVAAVLQGFGYNADELSADLSQNRREDVLRRLREGRVRLLVSTDVAARGIDIPDLSHVFLYEPPEDRESYIHRSGRTGRAGAAGTVISLVDIMQKLELKRIAQFYHIDLTQIRNPSDEDAAEAVWQREAARLGARLRACTGLQLERARRYLPAVRAIAAGDDEEQMLLLALLLDADCQRSLGLEQTLPQPKAPAPEQRQDDQERPASKKRPRKRSRRDGEAMGAAEEDRRDAQDGAPDPGAGREASGSDAAPDGAQDAAGPQDGGEPSGRRRRRRRSRRKPTREGEAAPAAETSAEGPSDGGHRGDWRD